MSGGWESGGTGGFGVLGKGLDVRACVCACKYITYLTEVSCDVM